MVDNPGNEYWTRSFRSFRPQPQRPRPQFYRWIGRVQSRGRPGQVQNTRGQWVNTVRIQRQPPVDLSRLFGR